MLKRKNMEAALYGTLVAGFVVAVADGAINGTAQNEYCDLKESEATALLNDPETAKQFENILDENSKLSLHWTYDAAADPDFPRLPVLGKTTCGAYISIEGPSQN